MPNRLISAIIQKQSPVTVAPETTVADAAQVMRESRIGAVLVTEGSRLVGIFTERDALFRVIAANLDPRQTQIGQVMTADPQTVTPNRPLAHAMYLMHRGGYRHVPVVENGRPLGMVSARDALGPELEEFQHQLDTLDKLSEIIG